MREASLRFIGAHDIKTKKKKKKKGKKEERDDM
jgi:hypothetical protein